MITEPQIKLASCLRELARYNEAEIVLKDCLEEVDDCDGSCDNELHARALTSLAVLYQAQSKYDAAIQLHEKAIPMARNNIEFPSTGLAENIAGYAETLRKAGHLPQAERYHREALEIRTRAIKNKSCTELELAVSYTQLGCTLAAMQQHQEAYEQHHLALTLRYRYLDFAHGLVAESLNYCAESLCALGRGVEGIPLVLHAVHIRKNLYGISHPAYAHALSVLASCYQGIGRHLDACEYLKKCLAICEVAFPKNHANMIPNLMSYGDVLRSTGDLEKARSVYQLAIDIHEFNFKKGQRARQLEMCQAEVSDLGRMIDEVASGLCCAPRFKHVTSIKNESIGAPVIVFTDIGRDVDDEMAMVLLSALKRKQMLNPLAVITTLSPERERANLARGSLDSMGMADVPVGVGSRGGVAPGVDLEVYEAEHSRSSPSIFESGMELACQVLKFVPPKSVQILCLASLTDVASLIKNHTELFTEKVKEVVVMGGVMPMETSDTLTPDSAYNNNCDLPSARFVYDRCQEYGVPTVTLSRWAAYGCPMRPALLDELAKTKHSVAVNIRTKSKRSIDQLWNKVILPSDHPGREKLPSRCNVKWFYKTFCGSEGVPAVLSTSIWTQVEKLNMYDPLAVLICVQNYRSSHFDCKTKIVAGVPHIVVGTSETETGVRNPLLLYTEYSSLFIESLQTSLHESEVPMGSEKAPNMLVEETTHILSSSCRAAQIVF